MNNHKTTVLMTKILVFINWKHEQTVSAPFYETKFKYVKRKVRGLWPLMLENLLPVGMAAGLF